MNVLAFDPSFASELISDSTGFYINALVLFLLSFIISLAWTLLDKKSKSHPLLFYFLMVLVRYYLSMQLLAYGFNKIFKWQFYLPEPNTLFTNLAEISPDLLFWSTMGLSRSYSIFTGALEILAALFLLFNRTKLLGSLLAFAMMLHIVVLNFSFNISVKLYSLFLLLLALVTITPYLSALYAFFWKQQPASIRDKINYPSRFGKMRKWLKTAAIVFLFADALAVYLKTGNFNDDTYPRPFLHGAYDVTTFVKNGDTILPLYTDTSRWKRVFIHRRNYLITQYGNNVMQDYELEYDTANNYLWINLPGNPLQVNIRYEIINDTTIVAETKLGKDHFLITLEKINLNQLPAMERRFNWTID